MKALKKLLSRVTKLPWEATIRTGMVAIFKKGEVPNCMSGEEGHAIHFQRGQGEPFEGDGYLMVTDEQEATYLYTTLATNHFAETVELLGDCRRLLEDGIENFSPVRGKEPEDYRIWSSLGYLLARIEAEAEKVIGEQ